MTFFLVASLAIRYNTGTFKSEVQNDYDCSQTAIHFITDAAGNPIGVILPLEEFAVVEDILEEHFPASSDARKLEQMERAANDHLFMADLRETMSAFAEVDAEWWKRNQ